VAGGGWRVAGSRSGLGWWVAVKGGRIIVKILFVISFHGVNDCDFINFDTTNFINIIIKTLFGPARF